MSDVPNPEATSRASSWIGYAAGACALAAVVAPYLLGSWWGPARYVLAIAAVIFAIAYCLVGAKLAHRPEPRPIKRNDA